jgi:transposase
MNRKCKLKPDVANALLKFGVPRKKVAEYFNVTTDAVSKMIKRQNDGPSGATIGRPEKLTMEVKNFIIDSLKEDSCLSSFEIAGMVHQKYHIDVVKHTVCNFLHSMGYHNTTVSQKRELSEKNKIVRLGWANVHFHKLMKNVIFVDETGFDSHGSRKLAWIGPGIDRPIHEEVNPFISVQIFCGISWNGISKVYFLPRGATKNSQKATTTAADYLKLLQRAFTNDSFFTDVDMKMFYQDNSPIHGAKKIRDYIDTKGLEIYQAPAVSPELNPIENIWAIMKQRMPNPCPTTVEGMRAAILEVHQNLKLTEIQNCIHHLLTVNKKIREANGGHVVGE